MFRKAGTAEIIRSHQKDDSFLDYMRTSIADIFQSISGPRLWIQWRRQLDLAADMTYFVLTTCSDLQTLGEEYVNIIQTDQTLRALPPKWRRVFMVGLQVGAPYLLIFSLEHVERQLRTSTSINLHPESRERILALLPLVQKAVTVVHRLHLATFYVHGIFYHLAKRILGIHYVQYMTRERGQGSMRPFQVLGYLSFAQLICSLCLGLFQLILAYKNQKKSNIQAQYEDVSYDAQVKPTEKCPLCLGRRRFSTLTPCGHVYCWNCIHEWCQTKQECPLCRDQFAPNRMVCLQNYDPS